MDVQTCPAHSQADHANMQSCLAPYQPGFEILKVRGYEQEINPNILSKIIVESAFYILDTSFFNLKPCYKPDKTPSFEQLGQDRLACRAKGCCWDNDINRGVLINPQIANRLCLWNVPIGKGQH